MPRSPRYHKEGSCNTVGTILMRRRSDGSPAYMAKIIIRRAGVVAHRESRTFDRQREAKAWLAQREAALQEGLPQASVTLAAAIERYLAEARREPGRTKAQVLGAILGHPIARMDCAAIRSHDLLTFATELAGDRLPQTVENYLSHLASIFQIAQPAWGIPLDPREMDAARKVARRLGVTGRSVRRDRRPSLEEMDALMSWFDGRPARALPMGAVVAFALYSTRRQEEILRLRWDDLEPGRALVRAMKHPGGTAGNDVWVDLPPEAEAIALSMPRTGERIFPYSVDAVGAAFTRACKMIGIVDLRFHDLRHEGISRLFEMGWTIPQVAQVSGHRSWSSLQRYAHLRHKGDRWAGWSWLEKMARGGT